MTRSLERSLTAGNSPASIARRTAFSESWHAVATSRMDRRCHRPGPGDDAGAAGVPGAGGSAPPVQVTRDVLMAMTASHGVYQIRDGY
jgi:hypothetical protein